MIRRDLRDHAGGVHVAAEDLAVEAERDHALLDAGAGALVDADDRAAGLHGEVHHLGDLLAVDLAERAAEDREVLGEHAHLAAVDGAVAGDHAVAVRAVASPGRTPSSGAGPARRARRTSPRRRAARSARGRSCGPWRAASRPPSPSRRARPRRGGGRGRRACRRWCGCRCPSGTSVPSPGCALTVWPRCRVAVANLVPMTDPTAARPPLDPDRLAVARTAGRSRCVDDGAVDQRRSSPSGPARARPAGLVRGRRAPDRRPRPARPDLGDAGPVRADLLGAAAARRRRRRTGRGCRC